MISGVQSDERIRQMGNAVTVKLDHFPGTGPYTFPAVRAAVVDDRDRCLHELDGIFGAHADTAAAKVAFAGPNVDHQWLVLRHEILSNVDVELKLGK